MLLLMLDLCKLIFGTVIDLLRSRVTLEAEIVVLRQQINVLRRARSQETLICVDRQADIGRRLPAVSQDV